MMILDADFFLSHQNFIKYVFTNDNVSQITSVASRTDFLNNINYKALLSKISAWVFVLSGFPSNFNFMYLIELFIHLNIKTNILMNSRFNITRASNFIFLDN